MTKNVILEDKQGNQLAPSTTAENVLYDESKNVKQQIDAITVTKVSELENDLKYVDNVMFYAEMQSYVSSQTNNFVLFYPSTKFSNLPALKYENTRYIYNVTDAFTTTSDFIEGAGISYEANTNLCMLYDNVSKSYKYKVLGGNKVNGSTNPTIYYPQANGVITNTTIDANDAYVGGGVLRFVVNSDDVVDNFNLPLLGMQITSPSDSYNINSSIVLTNGMIRTAKNVTSYIAQYTHRFENKTSASMSLTANIYGILLRK